MRKKSQCIGTSSETENPNEVINSRLEQHKENQKLVQRQEVQKRSISWKEREDYIHLAQSLTLSFTQSISTRKFWKRLSFWACPFSFFFCLQICLILCLIFDGLLRVLPNPFQTHPHPWKILHSFNNLRYSDNVNYSKVSFFCVDLLLNPCFIVLTAYRTSSAATFQIHQY